jgi:hypothetical protein
VGYRLPHEARCFVADPPGLEPRLTDSESAVLPTTPRVNGRLWLGTCGGIRTPCARRQLLYRQSRLTVFASHARHHRLPEQDSNLQSRINNPLVYRLTDRGIELRHERGASRPLLWRCRWSPPRSRLFKRAPRLARSGTCRAPSARRARGSSPSRLPAASDRPSDHCRTGTQPPG